MEISFNHFFLNPLNSVNLIKRILSFAVMMVITVSAFAQEDGPATYRILKIDTEGNKFYDSRLIIASSGLTEGSEISFPSDQTKQAIENVWNLKFFSDVQIFVSKNVGRDAYVTIKVEELPRLDKFSFSGNEEFDDEDLSEKTGLVKGQVIRPQSLKDMEYNIQRMYVEEGYPLAEIKVDQYVNSFNEAQINVRINEGSEVEISDIRFEGNSKISDDDLEDAMEETSVGTWWKFWESPEFNKENYEKDKRLVIDYYREQGFRDAAIVSDRFVYRSNKEEMDIVINVNEGPRYRINSIAFEGNKLYPDSVLVRSLDFSPGDVYNIKRFEQNLKGNEEQSDVSALYLDNGYLGFQSEIEEKIVGDDRVDIVVRVNENKQFRLGMISIIGNTKTQDKVIRRELFTLPGQHFNRTNLIRSMRELANLNYFNPETISYDFSQLNDTTVDLIYMVEERSSDQLNASVGYSATFGLSGSVGLTFNNFDIADPLSGGAGQILSFQWDFGTGGTFRTFSLGFTEPWLFDSPTLVGLNIFDTKQSYTYEIRETGATGTIGRRFRFPDDYVRGDWFLKFQRTDVINGAEIYEEGIRTQFSIGQTLSRNSVDNPIFPTLGSKISLFSELAGARVVGSINFHKHLFSAEAYNRLFGSTDIVLQTNFQFGSVSSLAEDAYIPPNEFFFMGGSGLAYNTIALRGYEDRTIGPLNRFANPTGGRVMMKYGAELRYSLSLDPVPIYLVLFGEAGNIWNSFKQTDLMDLRRSVGVGTRVILPAVGMIGFDLGYGFDRKLVDGQDPAWLFHFQFGRGF
jgi:outer membrane protein insertion porin family